MTAGPKFSKGGRDLENENRNSNYQSVELHIFFYSSKFIIKSILMKYELGNIRIGGQTWSRCDCEDVMS